MHVLDDLKSNFRAWELDHNTEHMAETLCRILTGRHPNEKASYIKQVAYAWVSYEEKPKETEILNKNKMKKTFVEPEQYPEVIKKIRKQLKDYLIESKLKSLVIGISGGIDSAVVVALANPVCKELGVHLIGRSITITTNTKDETIRAYLVGKAFCTNFEEIDLGPQFQSMVTIDIDDTNIKPYGDTRHDKIRHGNIKARMRMMYLYNLASKYQGMVLSTDNYTEYLLGFWTQHGDVGDYSPIQELWKTEVYGIAEVLAKESDDTNKESAMKLCINAMATDGLGVTDKGDLGQIFPTWQGSSRKGYEQVDQVLINDINGIKPSEVHDIIIERNRKTEFKRLTPIFIKRKSIV